MTIQLSTRNEIILDHKNTGYYLKQTETHTQITNLSGDLLSLPSKRYSLASSNPDSDSQGVDQFEIDFKKATGLE
jgi:hypothetical protein